jgi:predicted glycosyltransferase
MTFDRQRSNSARCSGICARRRRPDEIAARGGVNTSILFYVQHLLGIGHLRRALYLIEALADAGFAVTLVSGGEPLPDLGSAAARRVVQLPPIRASDPSFKRLIAADGGPLTTALWTARGEQLLAAFAEARPAAIVIEAYPFGRRAFRHELQALIGAAREQRPRPLVLCSVRDIVVPPARESRQHETVARISADFDAVLVHGDPRLVTLEASFPLTAAIADKLVYTGYVVAPAPSGAAEPSSAEDEVLVSVGGGAMGNGLLRTAVAARRQGWLSACRWRLLAGLNLPETDFAALTTDLPPGLVVERYRLDFPELLRRCRVSVSQAGYNTVLEILAARVPAVLVPFADLRESEQTLRAERLAARGIVEIVPEQALSPARLGAAIEQALRRPPPPIDIDTSGARRTAIIIREMIAKRASPAPAG